ncbi:unnamed protein product [Acanthoscelides obtectus]|uniref:Uncharacterized protein n=1 Tax=Acanthoscelides obtectus TaxID=200917 RepID=A0A9P0KYQ6_ACAOB|nr:unnamed protein product [Acanthoscelides obtectus]CAK1666202.1 hypothetical protein AOBTE_LOCUS25208 [Acanthoscelides obtectus]
MFKVSSILRCNSRGLNEPVSEGHFEACTPCTHSTNVSWRQSLALEREQHRPEFEGGAES